MALICFFNVDVAFVAAVKKHFTSLGMTRQSTVASSVNYILEQTAEQKNLFRNRATNAILCSASVKKYSMNNRQQACTAAGMGNKVSRLQTKNMCKLLTRMRGLYEETAATA